MATVFSVFNNKGGVGKTTYMFHIAHILSRRNASLGGAEASLRVQSAIYRYVKQAIDNLSIDIVLIDMGPNLGALNRAVLAGSDYFMTPVAPDLFSIQGTENLGSKLVTWKRQWEQVHENWRGEGLPIPSGKPIYLGYVQQMHNIRNNEEGMTEGWKIYGAKLEGAVRDNIVKRIGDDQVIKWENGSFRLGQIPNLHSLVPYSQEAKLPIFDCTGVHGLRGAHQTKAKASAKLFDPIIDTITQVMRKQ